MTVAAESLYRMRLAQGFLAESRQDRALSRWRSCVDNSQLATENAAKAVLALAAPVGRTHNPAALLRQALQAGTYPQAMRGEIEELTEHAELLGPDVHIRSDYGDETAGQTPWELFDRDAAEEALRMAEEAVHIAELVIAKMTP